MRLFFVFVWPLLLCMVDASVCDDMFGSNTCGAGVAALSFFNTSRVYVPAVIDGEYKRYVQMPFPNGTVTNFMLASSTSYHLDCSAIKFGLMGASLVRPRMGRVEATSSSVMCLVAWDDVFTDTTELAAVQLDPSLVMLIGASSAQAGFTVDIFQSFGSVFTFSADGRPNYYVIDLNAYITSPDVVQLQLTTANAKCPTGPSSALLDFNAANASCDCNATLTAGTNAGEWTGSVTMEFITRCANSVGSDGVYHMEVDPFVTNGAGCIGGMTVTGTQHATTVFDVKYVDNGRLVVDDTVVSAGQTVVFSTYEHAKSSMCNGNIHLMDKVVVSHTVRGVFSNKSPARVQKATSAGVLFGDYAMELDSTECTNSAVVASDFNVTLCTFKYVSLECIPMVQGASCDFEYKFGAFAHANTWMDDSENLLTLNVPIARKTDQLAACNTVRTINDVTSTTAARMSSFLTDVDTGIQIELLNVGENVSRTLAITDVRITVGTVSRMFSLADKVRLMTVPNTPYYDDVKYCRYIDLPSAGGSQTCPQSFFNLLKSGAMHDVDYNLIDPAKTNVGALQAGTSPWLLPNHGYIGCSDIRKRNVDRWSFNPLRWVFRDMRSLGVTTAAVQVTAVLSMCGGAGGASGRMLDGTEPTLVFRSTLNVPLVLEKPGDPAMSAGEIAGIAVGAFLAVVCILCICLIRRRRTRSASPPPPALTISV
jgi:hypothetical protein